MGAQAIKLGSCDKHPAYSLGLECRYVAYSQRCFRSVSDTEAARKKNSHIFTRLKIHHHVYISVNMPPMDIPVLAVCRMFVT